MISESIIANAAEYRRSFQSALPFKHLCIDEFFHRDAAEALLRDFPPFDREFARNEFGEYGGKAVISEISTISSFYARLHEYLLSAEFLSAMSAIMGIENLQGDPMLYGGGTHENLHGQELDPHVDFNYLTSGNGHRRANLLLYLNEEWDPGWGGAIELHSNPRRPDENVVREYNVTFNRAVIFETNEYSWHGFRKIQLPHNRRHLSRKCVSIYLYTPDRPAHEIAGPHGTFYVQRPFPGEITPGRVLSEDNVAELRAGYSRRDGQVEMYQKLEERLGREMSQLKDYLNEVLASIKAPIAGYGRQLGKCQGLFHDGWAARELTLRLHVDQKVTGLAIKGFIPEIFPEVRRAFEVTIDGNFFTFALDANVEFTFDCPLEIAAGSSVDISIRCSSDFNAGAEGKGEDHRNLAYYLSSVEMLSEGETSESRTRYAQLKNYLDEVLAAVKAPIAGYGGQLGNSRGLFHDGWATREARLRLRADRKVTGLAIKGFIPEAFPEVRRVFEVGIDANVFTFALDANAEFTFDCPMEVAAGDIVDISIRCGSDFNPAAAGKGDDQRSLAYYLSSIELSH